MYIPDYILESVETSFWVKNTLFSDADPDPRSKIGYGINHGNGTNSMAISF